MALEHEMALVAERMVVETPLLSLDPSSTHLGWALLGWDSTASQPAHVASGTIAAPAAPPDERVVTLGPTVSDLITRCRPASVLIEVPDFIAEWANPRRIIPFFRAVGVAEYAVYLSGVRRYYEKASRNRQNVCKKKNIEAFRAHLGRYPQSDDESDAFCMGWQFLLERNAPSSSAAAYTETLPAE